MIISLAEKRALFRKLADAGVFDSFSGTVPDAELNAFFRDDLPKRQKP